MNTSRLESRYSASEQDMPPALQALAWRTHTHTFAMARVECITCQRTFSHRAISSGFAAVHPCPRWWGKVGAGSWTPAHRYAEMFLGTSGRATTQHSTSLGMADTCGPQAKVCMVCAELHCVAGRARRNLAAVPPQFNSASRRPSP